MGDQMEAEMRKLSPEERARFAAHQPLGGGGPSLSMDDMRQMIQEPLPHLVPSMFKIARDVLTRMHLHLLTTDADPGFITSDYPAVMFDPTAYRRPPMWRSPGLGHKNIEVTLPLSPRHMLLLCWTAPEGSISGSVPGDFVDEFNRRAQFHCDKQFVVRRNVTKPYWFEVKVPPEDSEESNGAERGASP